MTTLPDGKYVMAHRDGDGWKPVRIVTINGQQMAKGDLLYWELAALIRIGYQFERVDDNATA